MPKLTGLQAARAVASLIQNPDLNDDEKEIAVNSAVKQSGFASLNDIRAEIGGNVTGVLQQGLSGSTLGGDDDLVGLVSSDPDAQEKESLEKRIFEFTDPAKSFAAQTVGGILPFLVFAPLASIGLLGRTAQIALKAAGMFGANPLGRAVRGLATGAVGGGIQGTLDAEGDLVQRLKQGGLPGLVVGGASGGILDAAGGPVVDAVVQAGRRAGSAVLRPIAETMSPELGRLRARQGAQTDFADRLAEQQQTPDQAANELQRRLDAGTPSVAADLGPSTQDVVSDIANARGAGSTQIRDTLTARQIDPEIGSGARIKNLFSRALESPDRGRAFLQGLVKRQKEDSVPLYNEAFKLTIPRNRTLESILLTPEGKLAIAAAERRVANQVTQGGLSRKLPNILGKKNGRDVVENFPTLQVFDDIKKGFDRVIEKEIDPVSGKISAVGRDAVKLKNRMLDQLDRATAKPGKGKASSPYHQARAKWAGTAQANEAYAEGLKWARSSMNAEDLGASLDMILEKGVRGENIESVRQAFLGGALTATEDLVNRSTTGTNVVTKFLNIPNNRAKLRKLFADTPEGQSRFDLVIQTLEDEGATTRTFGRTKNSETAGRQAGQDRINTAAGVPKRGDNFISQALDTLAGPAQRQRLQAAQQELTDLALTADPDRLRGLTPSQLERLPGTSIAAPALPLAAGQRAPGLLVDDEDPSLSLLGP